MAVDDGDVDVFCLKDGGGVKALCDNWAGTDNGEVCALFEDLSFANFKWSFYGCELGCFFASETHIGGATIFCECEGCFFGLFVICGNDDNHIGKCAHERDVFKHLMGGAVRADGDASVGADDFDVAIVVANSCTNLFPATAGAEAGVGGNERNFTHSS